MRFRDLFALLLTATLAGCSSGGGNSGGGSGPSGSVSITTNTLSFTANVSEATAAVQALTGTINNPDSEVFLIVDFGYSNLFSDWSYSTSGTQATLFLNPVSPQQIGAGVHTGQIEVRVCRDQNCTSQYSGSPKTVNVTYTVTASGFTLSANEINLVHVFGSALPDAQEIIATALGPWVSYGWTYSDFPRDSGWIDLVYNQPQNGVGAVIYQFGLSKPLPAGEYSTSFGLYFDGPAAAKPVAVNVTVLEPAFLIDDNLVDFSYTLDTDLATLQQTITVSDGSYGPRTWSVSSDVAWLDISHDSGNTSDSNSFVVSVNTDVQNLQSGQHKAWINLSDVAGAYEDVRILVRLAKNSSPQTEPEIGCLEEAGVIFVDCESNEWNGFTAWELRADGGMPSYTEPMPGFHLIDWSFVDAEGRGKVVDVQYGYVDARAMLRVHATGKARDLSHYAGGTVEFDVRVLDWGSTVNGLEFKLECVWPCESGSFALNIPNLNQWYHFSFDVDQLQATGFDLTNADMGFQIFPAWEGGSMNGIHFQLDNIRWNR